MKHFKVENGELAYLSEENIGYYGFESDSQATSTGYKLLSLDGGGVRGLSSLYILQHLMHKINPLSPPKPCEVFDMIAGTSTGGYVIHVMLKAKLTTGSV